MQMQASSLFYSDLGTGGTSDKEYHVQIEKKGSGHVVNFQYGRRGGTLQTGTKTPAPVPLAEATVIYERLVREKLSKGYVGAEASTFKPPVLPNGNGNGKTKFPVELLTEISRQEADAALKSAAYWLQKKMDGHRRQLERKADGSVVSYNRKGEAVALPQELVRDCENAPWDNFVLDGELLGNVFYAFDLLNANGLSLADKRYDDRFFELKTLRESAHLKLCPTWITSKSKAAGAAELYKIRAEGLVFKRADAKYKAGRNGQHLKFKFLKTATCKVLELATKGHDNASLGLYDADAKKWVNVGSASMIGKDARIAVGSLVEVRFLYCTDGHRLYQPRIIGLRDDIGDKACTFAQLTHAYKEGV